jgi:asparagine synthase (glutamine-hydrolysing)
MCGIVGYVGPAPLGQARIDAALSLMGRRGPDHRAHRRFTTPDGRTVELLHSRLSIIDLDPRANQPFEVDGRWMTYNGELYNYVEVRQRLEAAGVEFLTSSDTEVLLAAIARDGWQALDRCEGMWGFAVYEEASGRLTLSRDRFGEKPLYLLSDGRGGLLFGSEPKFLFALLGRTPPVNERQLQRLLVNGYKSLYKTGETFFDGLEELPPGALLHIESRGAMRRERYWTPPRMSANGADDFAAAVAGTRERLVRSVELRLRADVPLAFCMSGGVDSQALIATAKRVFDFDVHGFTIVNRDERYDEQDLIDHSVAELGLRHSPVELDTAGFLPNLRELVRQHDAPVYTITYYVHWVLMRAIHEAGYRVSISGTAADELFTGYFDHHLAYLSAVRGEPALHAVSLANWQREIKPLVRNPFLSNPDLFVEDPGFRDHIYLGAEDFAAGLRDPFSEPFFERPFGTDVLRTRMFNELFAEAVPVILHEDDLNAMYYSIENRSPFLDRELYEYTLTLPTRHLVRDGRAKAVLRESMRGIVPDRILDNPRKVGFNAPIHELLDTRDRSVCAELLDPRSPVWSIVRREPIEAILQREYLPNSESKFLFNFVCAKLFLEEVAGG